ncbi:MAG: hypothetical protein ACKVQB_03585 [Bacteroidia bacterium]
MSSHQHDIELIERFFRQELNEDELLAFENRVRQDPEFSKEVIKMRDIFYTVKMAARNDLKEELKEIQTEALTQPIKPYKPGIKWLKWIKGLIISAAIVSSVYFLGNSSVIETFKSMMHKDSVAVYDTIQSATPEPQASGQTIIKDPSDSRYDNMTADFKLQVKDPKTFKIKKTGQSENGLYNYEIQADGETHNVSSPNPNLTEELLKKKDENVIVEPDPIEGVDMEEPEIKDSIDNYGTAIPKRKRRFARKRNNF